MAIDGGIWKDFALTGRGTVGAKSSIKTTVYEGRQPGRLSQGCLKRGRRFRELVLTRFGHLRVTRLACTILGFRHHRALRRIEIDITYACNLTCPNCNRSCGQAPTGERMTLEQIDSFVRESIAKDVKWERIRLLGGEPTLHPGFFEILSLLISYRDTFSKNTVIEVITNGYGKKVESIIAKIPAGIVINNTHKKADVTPNFDTFNVAPRDLKAYKHADYRSGCWKIRECGIGLSSSGYYPCPVAPGIDRIFGWDAGRQNLPSDDDDMRDLMERFCGHCGHFKRNLEGTVTYPVMSATWREAYERYKRVKPTLTRYGVRDRTT
jgi:MoaA/NifB/PqqE/SkfB family radical SAM enzyme